MRFTASLLRKGVPETVIVLESACLTTRFWDLL
jgi:hypothetical protein